MIWQDYAILAAQGGMLIALIPTLRDRARWPHPATAAVTSCALAIMACTLASLSLWLSAAIVTLLAVAWARMAMGTFGAGGRDRTEHLLGGSQARSPLRHARGEGMEIKPDRMTSRIAKGDFGGYVGGPAAEFDAGATYTFQARGDDGQWYQWTGQRPTIVGDRARFWLRDGAPIAAPKDLAESTGIEPVRP